MNLKWNNPFLYDVTNQLRKWWKGWSTKSTRLERLERLKGQKTCRRYVWVFDHFVGLALKGLSNLGFTIQCVRLQTNLLIQSIQFAIFSVNRWTNKGPINPNLVSRKCLGMCGGIGYLKYFHTSNRVDCDVTILTFWKIAALIQHILGRLQFSKLRSNWPGSYCWSNY